MPITYLPSPRQQQVLELLAEGLCSKAIARRLGISPETVRKHSAALRQQSNVSSSMALALRWSSAHRAQSSCSAPRLLQVLTSREKEIALLLREGHTAKHIAKELGLSPATVAKHRENLLSKLGLKSVRELIQLAPS
ncbi:response regulator transcription factor [Duganella caerulea]|uniref:response regulator transcription factor n=1 Tax=Duganella caerulea TaxID=2885762 RepID=UPI004037F3A5